MIRNNASKTRVTQLLLVAILSSACNGISFIKINTKLVIKYCIFVFLTSEN